MCERWVGDWTKTATCWPPVPLSLAAFLSHSAGLLNRGPWGPSSLLGLVLTASNCNNWLQTNWTSCHTGLYHCLAPTCFLWASHLHWIQPAHSQGYPLKSSTGCICSLIDSWVGGQYVTKNKNSPSTINSHLLFDVQCAYSSKRERERICKGLWTDTDQPNWTLNANFWQLTDWLADYIFFKIRSFLYIWIQDIGGGGGWCHLAKLLGHLSRVPNSLFSFLQSNLSQTRYESILFTFWPSCVVRYVLAWTF